MMKPIAILHEDNGHKNLILSLIEYLNQKDNVLNVDLIDFYGIGSKSYFFDLEYKSYKLLKQRKGNPLKKVLFIVDSDDEKDDAKYKGFENTERELINIINELGFQDIADFYIICDPITKKGYLESLIFASLKEEKKKCIEEFIKCSDINPKNFYKTIIYNLHNMAYPNDSSYYNFEHPYFDELKEKLMNLFEKKEEQVC